MILKNKKGADKIITIYWFAILMLVAAGVFTMVLAFQTPYDVRELEASILTNQIADYLAPQGILDSNVVLKLQSGETIGMTCQTNEECQKITGNRIMEIVGSMKSDLGVVDLDEGVRNQGVAENFECLVVQIALQESRLKHCKEFKNEGGDPFYCEGDKAQSNPSYDLDNEGNPKSWGIMQIYKSKHSSSTPENFEDSVKYATKNVLTANYDLSPKSYACKSTSYSGWERALRFYNGWNTNCMIGDLDYVENVVGKKDDVAKLFPSQCSSTEGIKISKEANLNIDNGQYYFEVYFNNFTSGDSLNSVKEGNLNLKADCKIQKDEEHQKLSKCFERSFYAIDEKNNPYSIKILTVVRKTEKNVA